MSRDLIVIDGDVRVEFFFPPRELPETPADDPEDGCGAVVLVELGEERETCTCTRSPGHTGDHVAHGFEGGVLVAMARWSAPPAPKGRPS